MSQLLPLPPDPEARRGAREGLGPLEGEAAKDWSQATRLAHELRVHQIELETQNRVLQETRLEAEAGWDHFRELYDFAPVGYFTVDRQGLILQANLQGASLLGVERARLVESRFGLFIEPCDRERFSVFLASGLEGRTPRTCEVSLLRAGARVRLECSAPSARWQLPLVVVDITDLHAAREEVRQLNEDLERRVALRTAELEMAYADLQAFGYMISHELRAPLARLEGFSRMLQKARVEDGPGPLRHLAERIEVSSQRMREVVDSLLMLSRLALEKMSPEPVDLSEAAAEIMATLGREGQPVPARVRIQEGVITHGDRRLLALCLANLLGNAVKFSTRTPQAEVEFGETVRNGRRCAFVRDNGAGFEMAHADKLFQAFVRLHRQEEFSGSGLGLNIARKIIEKHGGSLWAESVPGAGATFYFTLA